MRFRNRFIFFPSPFKLTESGLHWADPDQNVSFRSKYEAALFLEDTLQSAGGMQWLRYLASQLGQQRLPWMDDDEVYQWLVQELASDGLGNSNPWPEFVTSWEPPKPRAKEAQPAAAPATGPSKLEVKIVWADNGEPVSGIVMSVQTPEGNSFSRTTNSEGRVAVDTAEEGLCALNCSFSQVQMTEVVVFAGEGDVPEAERNKAATERPESVLSIVNVTAHRVRTGDTINELARAVGLTWKELAYFNWGTESPDEINKHLSKDVGCTKRTRDGNNLMFDDSDEPGIIYLPRAWSLKSLATGGSYTIRVRTPEKKWKEFIFSR